MMWSTVVAGSMRAASYQLVRGGPITSAPPELIALWDRSHPRPNRDDSLVGHFSWIGALEFSPDGPYLASGGGQFTKDLGSFYAEGHIGNRVHRNNVHDLVFSPDAKGQAPKDLTPY
jgi:WD40 repeat protein